MADVTIKYDGYVIAEMSETGSKTLETSGKFCEGNFDVEYIAKEAIPSDRQHAKSWRVNVPTAVARKYVTLVTGDADIAAHYADESAVATVIKLTNNTSNGIDMLTTRNRTDPAGATTVVIGRDAKSGTYAFGELSLTLRNEQNTSAGLYHVLATANGELKVLANATKTNFGGADYLVIFGW